MSRWFQIGLAVVLYAAFMAGVAWALQVWGRPAYDWLWDMIGGAGVWGLLITILLPAGIYGYWPRRPDGTMRRLRSPWD